MSETTPANRWTTAIEAKSVGFVTADERHGKAWKQGPFWFTCNFNFFSVALGFLGPSLGLSLPWTILAGTAGSTFGALFVALHGTQGPRLGLPQMIQSRAQFGCRGVLIPVLVVLFDFMVFNVLQGDVLKSGLHGVFGWNPVAVVIGASALAALLAILGHDWLHKTLRIVFWVSIPFYTILTVAMFTGDAGNSTSPGPALTGFQLSAFMAVFAAAASYNLSLAPFVSDYTRYLPADTSPWRVVLAIQGGTTLALAWLMGMGAWLASRTGASDGLVSLLTSGNLVVGHLGTLLAVLSAVGLIAVMGVNTYSAVLSLATIIDCFRAMPESRAFRVVATLALMAIWVTVILGLDSDQSTLIVNLLNIMFYLLVPWTAVNLVDYFLVRRGHYAIGEIIERGGGIYGQWAWRGLVAYFLGLAAEVPFMVLSFYHGPIAQRLNGIDLSFAVGLIAAGLVYVLLFRHLQSDGAVETSRHTAEALGDDTPPLAGAPAMESPRDLRRLE